MEQTNESCNGWSNYETWLVACWLDNDEPIYHLVQAKVQKYVDRSRNRKFTPYTPKALSNWLHQLLVDGELPHEFYNDFKGYGRRKINWLEIATNLIEERITATTPVLRN